MGKIEAEFDNQIRFAIRSWNRNENILIGQESRARPEQKIFFYKIRVTISCFHFY
jgi:hypothetical protein